MKRKALDDGNFFASPTLEQLAAAQGVNPLKDPGSLAGLLSGNEVEDFIATIYDTRERSTPRLASVPDEPK